jgi:hypothetical protein
MSKYPECSVARIAIYPDCRQKNSGSCSDICQNRAFGQSDISRNAVRNDIFTSVSTSFFTIRAKSCPNMSNPEIFRNECFQNILEMLVAFLLDLSHS